MNDIKTNKIHKFMKLNCVSRDTYILTMEGHRQIKDYINKAVTVWTGIRWSNVIIKSNLENMKLIKITLSNGAELKCGYTHDFFVKNIVNKTNHTIKKSSELQLGDEIINFKLPKNKQPVSINNADYKYDIVPLEECSNNILNWFINLCTEHNSAQIYSDNKPYLLQIRLALQSCGVESHVLDNNGGFRLCMPIKSLNILSKYYSFTRFITKSQISNCDHNIIINIEYLDSLEETCCVMGNKNNPILFNGMIT